MAKYITSDQVCEMFGITKVTLWRWEVKTQWGVPFPAPALSSVGGAPKRYLSKDVANWEKKCFGKKATATVALPF